LIAALVVRQVTVLLQGWAVRGLLVPGADTPQVLLLEGLCSSYGAGATARLDASKTSVSGVALRLVVVLL
jgi:hypothetical protein